MQMTILHHTNRTADKMTRIHAHMYTPEGTQAWFEEEVSGQEQMQRERQNAHVSKACHGASDLKRRKLRTAQRRDSKDG